MADFIALTSSASPSSSFAAESSCSAAIAESTDVMAENEEAPKCDNERERKKEKRDRNAWVPDDGWGESMRAAIQMAYDRTAEP